MNRTDSTEYLHSVGIEVDNYIGGGVLQITEAVDVKQTLMNLIDATSALVILTVLVKLCATLHGFLLYSDLSIQFD